MNEIGPTLRLSEILTIRNSSENFLVCYVDSSGDFRTEVFFLRKLSNGQDRASRAYRGRVRAIRLLHGESQLEFSQRTGIPYKIWNHYERGFPMSKESAFLVREVVPGISLDWIYFGDFSGIPVGLLERLQKLEREEIVRYQRTSPHRPEQTRTHLQRKGSRRISKDDRS